MKFNKTKETYKLKYSKMFTNMYNNFIVKEIVGKNKITCMYLQALLKYD